MKKKATFQLISFYSPLLIAVFFACILTQTGCNNAGGQTNQQKSDKFISLDITFLPNTKDEMKDQSIRAIENMLRKSLSPFRKEHASYSPRISINKPLFGDPNRYLVTVTNSYSVSGRCDTCPLPPPCPPCPGTCPACSGYQALVSGASSYGIEKIVMLENK